MVARSPQEAKEIQNILKYFKEGSVPNIGSSDDTAGKKFKQFHFISVAIFLVQFTASLYIVVTNIIQDV